MAFEFLFSSLPALPDDTGAPLTLTPSKLFSMCDEEGGTAARLVRAILISFDVRALEMMGFGLEPFDAAIFTDEELAERKDFPEWLTKALDSDGEGYAYAFDRIWEAYYRELARLASETGSRFLKRWVSWEVGLRNEIGKLRAVRAGHPDASLNIGGISEEYASIYRPALDSLVARMDAGFDQWREMDRSVEHLRLSKIRALAPLYTFTMDELCGYATRYVILRKGSYLTR